MVSVIFAVLDGHSDPLHLLLNFYGSF